MKARVKFWIFTCLLLCSQQATSERIKDLATIRGVRDNQLIGYGLVAGLDGTGDQTTQTPFTVQSIISMMQQLGVSIPPNTSLQLKNIAAVMVTATLPPFAQPGQQLDVTVSSMGNAKTLSGGTLLLTPLKGADNQVYAMAQGNVLVGGVGAAAAGSKAQINHLTVGRISSGATEYSRLFYGNPRRQCAEPALRRRHRRGTGWQGSQGARAAGQRLARVVYRRP